MWPFNKKDKLITNTAIDNDAYGIELGTCLPLGLPSPFSNFLNTSSPLPIMRNLEADIRTRDSNNLVLLRDQKRVIDRSVFPAPSIPSFNSPEITEYQTTSGQLVNNYVIGLD